MKRNPLIAMIIPLILITTIMLAPFIFKYIEDTYGFTVLSGLEVIGSDDDQSGNIRKLLFQSAWEQFTNSPVIGDGLEEKSMRFYPHNNIIEAFMATGLLGGSIILTLYFLSIINSLKLIISNSEYTWVGLILLQYIVFTQFSGALWQSGALFSLMAIASVSIKILKD
jgi:O-antigen ligase